MIDLAFYYDEMVRSQLLELEIQTAEGKIILKRLSKDSGRGHPLRRRSDSSFEPYYEAPHASPPQARQAPQQPQTPSNYKVITTPIIGVFYRASTPQSAPFAKEGDLIDVGSTICIIEAMKVMNEIKSDCKGKIAKILVENAKPVAKDQPLFYIEPA